MSVASAHLPHDVVTAVAAPPDLSADARWWLLSTPNDQPILMTSTAALSGFFPLVIATGASQLSQRSLGAVIFGGLLVSTFTSLFIVPAVYTSVKTFSHRAITASPAVAEDDSAEA